MRPAKKIITRWPKDKLTKSNNNKLKTEEWKVHREFWQFLAYCSESRRQKDTPGDWLVQDGGVEGCALTPSCESTGITTNCWTIIDRKTLELTRKDTPHPMTKEKPQWDGRRGAITIKSNPITAGWATHKLDNTYITEVHPLEWRFWAPPQASQPGGLATGKGIPRESDFEG